MEMPEEQDSVFDVARGVTETLLSLMGVTASVKPTSEYPAGVEAEDDSSVKLNIEGEDLGILIGRRGQTVASLQYIVRLLVGHKTQLRLPIVIDVEGYKQRRCESLRALALRIAEQVGSEKAPFSLEPMSAFERRIIHLALADHPEVTTESTGQGEARKVVILPREDSA